MIVDVDRIDSDDVYASELRHRCETDHFFLARLILGKKFKFHPELHKPAVDLYFPKNRNLSIEAQHPIKNRMHLDPRLTFKTTLGRIDDVQWYITFPEEITALNQTSTQDLAFAISRSEAEYFWRGKGKPATVLQRLYPHLVTDKQPFAGQGDRSWNIPTHSSEGGIDSTISYTSPNTVQSGWHPYLLNSDDLVETKNSGKNATAEVRQGVIDTYRTNRYTLMPGGYNNVRGTRYHPFDLYGDLIEKMDPSQWKLLIRGAMVVKSGQRLMPGDFPAEEDVEVIFAALPDMDYMSLRQRFFDAYDSFMCFCAGSRVLMADWSEKPIEALQVGDEVIGLEKKGRYGSRFVKTRVVRTFARPAWAVETTIEGNRKVRHTPDHRFLRPANGGAMRYARLRPGCKTVSVYKPIPSPLPEQQRDIDWLGGILDGEGSIFKTATAIHQKEDVNPEIHAGIIEVLNRLGIRFSLGNTHRTGRFSLLGGRSLLIWLLNNARMMKKKRIHKALWAAKQHADTCGRGGGGHHPKVVSMEPIGEQWVYDIETDTHNFVCEGFAVHNCQMMNDPQGGNVPLWDEKLWATMQIAPERVPPIGEVFCCWRFPYGAKKYMATAEGIAARIHEGKVYVLDAWTMADPSPSKLAEKVVREAKRQQTNLVVAEDFPGVHYLEQHIRNEATRRNMSLKFNWLYFEDDDNQRSERMRATEPQCRAGKVWISQASGKLIEMKRQFCNFGLVPETGLVDCVSRMAAKVPLSLLRTEIEEDERELQIRARHAVMSHFVYGDGVPGVQALEDRQAMERAASNAAMESALSVGLTDVLGGLDG